MTHTLLDQLDYIYFFHGLVLFLLGSVCVSMSRNEDLPTPWWVLGLFGFMHGTAEWLHLIAQTIGDSTQFSLARELLLAASFLALLEFARRTHRVVRGRTPGPWIHLVPIAGVLTLVAAHGTAHVASAVRPLIAAPAIFWTAWLFIFASRHSDDLGGGADAFRARILASIYFTIFGLVAGLVVPAAPFIPPGWPSPDALLATTGIPIQILRGAIVSMIALSVWALAVANDQKGRVLRKKRRLFWIMASTLGLLLMVGWAMTDRLGRLHDQDTVHDAAASTLQVQDHLHGELKQADRAVRSMADLLGRFHLIGGAPGQKRLDDLVDAFAIGADGWITCVLDEKGRAIASSNRGRADSFVGKDFAARPYFKAARAGSPGRFFGVGPVTTTPGYYASAPVTGAGGAVVAVAVVQRELSADQLGPSVVAESFLVAADGSLLFGTRDLGEGRPLWGPSGASERGPAAAVFPQLLDGTAWVNLEGRRMVAVRQPVPDSDWSLLVLVRERTQVANRLLGIVITFLLCTLVLAWFVAMQRQLGAESQVNARRLDAEGRARDSKRRADTDALTGLLNRLGFDGLYANELERSRRYGQPLSVVMFDLDHFKRVNDQHGHAAGDQVLVGTARIVETNVRDSDTVARWGGEEFVVMAASTAATGGIRLAEKLRGLMAATALGPAGPVTGSFGVAELRPDDTAESLLERADAALYRAKSQGRNRVASDDADVVAALANPSLPKGPVPAAPLLDGTSRYAATGFAPIDIEHRALSEAIESFFGMLSTGKGEEVQVAFESIIAGISIHFGHEERLMAAHGYQDRVRHAGQHAQFVAEAGRLHEELLESGVTVPFRRWAVARLPEWFRLHILENDVSLGRFLAERGAVNGEAPARRAGLSLVVHDG